MTGNAWSAFHYVPVRMALCATVGVFHNFDAKQERDENEEMEEANLSDESSSEG